MSDMKDASGDLASFRGVVTGRVQGVNFRSFVLRQATAMDLTGYVRNLPGGRAVEVWAEGPRDRLERLIELLHEGPRMAVVEDVGVEWAEYQARHAFFEVKF